MNLDTIIDKLTPCLIEASTGKILPTVFSLATTEDVSNLPAKGWNFDWSDAALATTNIYKLLVNGDDTVQGLISAEIGKGTVFVQLTESAPHNLGENKQYIGVGGHLFAIAMRLSEALGFGGYIYFDAKNMELVEHYQKTLGANRVVSRIHEYRMEVLEENASAVMEQYTLEGDLHVNRS